MEICGQILISLVEWDFFSCNLSCWIFEKVSVLGSHCCLFMQILLGEIFIKILFFCWIYSLNFKWFFFLFFFFLFYHCCYLFVTNISGFFNWIKCYFHLFFFFFFFFFFSKILNDNKFKITNLLKIAFKL